MNFPLTLYQELSVWPLECGRSLGTLFPKLGGKRHWASTLPSLLDYHSDGLESLLVAQMVMNLICKKFNPWVRKIPWRREWLATPVFLPWEFHGQRGLASYSPWGHKEVDMSEGLTHYTALKEASSVMWRLSRNSMERRLQRGPQHSNQWQCNEPSGKPMFQPLWVTACLYLVFLPFDVIATIRVLHTILGWK